VKFVRLYEESSKEVSAWAIGPLKHLGREKIGWSVRIEVQSWSVSIASESVLSSKKERDLEVPTANLTRFQLARP